jgi:hypothetical protein
MTNLPRRPIEPLVPAPDSFDRVLATARRRRRKRGLIAASSTMVVVLVAAGSFALGASLHATNRFDPANHSKGDNSRSPEIPQPTRSPSKSPKSSRSGDAKTNSASIIWLHGRAIDASGNGIAGLYVQPGRPSQRTFSSGGVAGTTTDSRGYFKVVCPHAPVLLSTWQVNKNYAESTVGGRLAATFVGSTNGEQVVPTCDSRTVTILSAGATVTGQVVAYGPCIPDDVYDVWLWLGGDHDTTIRLAALHNGDTFSYSGLPAGTHILGVRHQTKTVDVGPGAGIEADVWFQCDGTTSVPSGTTDQSSPPATASPEVEATPSPTPTPTIN